MAKYMKQREVATKCGLGLSSYGNVESSRYRVVGEDRAKLIASALSLDPDQAVELMAAWERTPLSEYSQKRRDTWAKRNALRSKSKNHDRLRDSLVEMVSLVVSTAPAGQLCVCGFDGKSEADPTRACELCTALEALGLPAFTAVPELIDQLGRLQDKIEAARAPVVAA